MCNDFGLLSLGPIIHGRPGGGVVECDACGIVAKRRAEKEAQSKVERASRYLIELRAGLGQLAACSFASFAADRPLVEHTWNDERQSVGAQRRALASAITIARVYAASPQGWLYLYGPPGAGKSHLAAAIANDLVKNGEPVAYASVPELLAFLKRGMNDNSSDARIEGLIGVDCLILDDLGAENVTPWSTETLFRLIDERGKHERPTVITSNVHFDALQFRIASRIAGVAKLVPLLVSDYRRLPR